MVDGLDVMTGGADLGYSDAALPHLMPPGESAPRDERSTALEGYLEGRSLPG